MRVKFVLGNQREFLEKVMQEIGSPSLRELSRRLDVNYSTMKNYYVGLRLIPKELFDNLVLVSGVKGDVNLIEDFWGQIKGGRKSKRKFVRGD